MNKQVAEIGQIWRDDRYYLNQTTGEFKRKYLLVLATNVRSGDVLTAVFTSKPNGLTEVPVCSLGPPRAGYFVGIQGGVLTKPTWVDFSSINILDTYDFDLHVSHGRKFLTDSLISKETCCGVLRCAGLTTQFLI